MDDHAEILKRIRETKTSKAFIFKKLVKLEHPELYDCFLRILSEYVNLRIDYGNMLQQVSTLFSSHPKVIRLFCDSFPQTKHTKNVNVHDCTETLGPAKKAKIEDDGTKAITEFGPTSNASTSYASNCTRSPFSSGWYPLEGNTVASGSSSSSQSWPGNFAETNEAPKEKTAQWIGRTLYVTKTETKIIDAQAHQRFAEVLIELRTNRTDTCAIMERASKLLQGHPKMIELLKAFLPDGYRIVILSDDHEMSTD